MIDFPPQFRPLRTVWHPSSASRSGGRSLNGSEQVVRSDAGFWTCQMEAVVYGEEGSLAWGAFTARAQGMSGEIIVPCLTPWRPSDANGRPYSPYHGGIAGGLNQHVMLAPAPEPNVTLRGAASLGDTEITITHPGIPPLRAGHFFGIGQRLYLIHTAYSLSLEQVISGGEAVYGGELLTYGGAPLTYGSGGGRSGENVQVLRFWPRLRKGADAGSQIRVSSPVCKMRLASDDSGVLSQPYGIAGNVTVDFVEVY